MTKQRYKVFRHMGPPREELLNDIWAKNYTLIFILKENKETYLSYWSCDD